MGKSWTATYKPVKSEYSLIPQTKINSKWLKDLNIRYDTIKLLLENISKTFFDINLSNVFLGPSPKAIEIKAKLNKWDVIKFICFCTAKEIINKMKRQFTAWEKIFENDVTNKGLISKIHKQLIPTDKQKTTQSKNEQKT